MILRILKFNISRIFWKVCKLPFILYKSLNYPYSTSIFKIIARTELDILFCKMNTSQISCIKFQIIALTVQITKPSWFAFNLENWCQKMVFPFQNESYKCPFIFQVQLSYYYIGFWRRGVRSLWPICVSR